MDRIDIGSTIRQLINRNNVMVRSLGILDEEIRLLFLRDRRKALLLFRAKCHESEISWPHDPFLDIFDKHLAAGMKKDESVIVILPGPQQTRYVIQTVVAEIFLDRFRLRMLDPRHFARHHFAEPVPFTLWLIPDVMIVKMEKAEADMYRESILSEDKGVVRDFYLIREEAKDQEQLKRQLLTLPRLTGFCRNISLGGAGLVCSTVWDVELPGKVVYLSLQANLTKKPASGPPLTLAVENFAVIRSMTPAQDGHHLHLMYLHPLPGGIIPYFPKTSSAMA